MKKSILIILGAAGVLAILAGTAFAAPLVAARDGTTVSAQDLLQTHISLDLTTPIIVAQRPKGDGSPPWIILSIDKSADKWISPTAAIQNKEVDPLRDTKRVAIQAMATPYVVMAKDPNKSGPTLATNAACKEWEHNPGSEVLALLIKPIISNTCCIGIAPAAG